MISQLTQIAKIDSLLSTLATKRFNAILPVNIEVLQKNSSNRYDLRIGTRELGTKSTLELEVGKKYWGVMKEDMKTGMISLSKLLKKPSLLQNNSKLLSFLPEFTPGRMVEVLSSGSAKSEMKTIILEHMAKANSKQEFMTLANIISALNGNVFTMVLKYEQKSGLFQFKKRRTQSQTSSEDGIIDFYAAFEHIGPLEGAVEVNADIRRLTLYLYYEESLEFLKEELSHLDFEGRLFHKSEQISPLYEPVPSLLDLKG